MEKACFRLFLCAALIVALSAFNRADAANVSVSSMNVKVNGVPQTVQAYLIDGNNYFKLRDLAMMLHETPNRFEVGYDSETKTVTMTTGQDYTPAGGELERGKDLSATCTPSVCTLQIDGTQRTCQSYNIGGNNYFKLRDLSPSIRLSVAYDGQTRTVFLRSIMTNTQPPVDKSLGGERPELKASPRSTGEKNKTKMVYTIDGKTAYYEITEEFPEEHRRVTTFYTADDRVYSIIRMQDDENGNQIRWELALENGMVLEYTQSSYDEQNRWLRAENYYGDGMMSGYSEAEYDEHGRPLKERSYSVNGKNEAELSLVTVFEYQNGKLWKVKTCDAGGQVLHEESFAGKDVLTYGHYKFD